MTAFIEEHRGEFGVEPMCKMLQIAQSTYYERRSIARDPDRASARAKSDADLCIKINAAWEENRKLYGVRKIWHVLLRDNQEIARCTVERLMRNLGIKGVVRGKKVVTTNPDTSQPCPDDKVNRLFKADRPNQLWVSDFTYVPTWSGTVYVAFVIDVFARRIVGWRVSVIPPKISGVQKWNFLGKVSEEIYDEERTIQRRTDHGSVEAGGGRCAGL